MKPAVRISPVLSASVLAFVAVAVIFPAAAQQPIIYPAKGQSAQQQASDMGQCEAWAKQNTGVDPAALAQHAANQTPAQQPSGGRVRGAAGGAAVGAAVGAIAGDAGKGAAIGAAGGAVGGGIRQRRQAQSQQQQQQATQQQASQQLATYNRALSACMSGRGYTIQ
ncbi:glycine zipper domain-containing protein [Paraburkholderia sp. SARCC-3016]|uniref:YMGG-like glycine zipper-containing protein n=1 Tax=Paraburkholderia sp. SARCC-3016 TaxID=3058611 RepID=UPI00280753D5|nr:YMGG-like glycine zipper-containing protein [Paraburkholderia sp. SARCC-3016]MDQ7978675.1 glycine zipper domain-containing protein [Paraburkholderia sp. SARCC-3016]